jgi:DnaK suppressor protein
MERKSTKKAADAAPASAKAAAAASASAASTPATPAVKPASASKTKSAAATPATPVADTPKPAAAKKSASKIMTEAELLAVPAKDYMNDAQLAFFRNRLRQQKEELLANVRDTSEHLRETEATSDVSDRATQEEEQALELRTRDRERKLLKKIDEALQRIEEGAYGYCAETGEPIGIRRLLARPTATLTIEAQERRERMQRMYGD